MIGPLTHVKTAGREEMRNIRKKVKQSRNIDREMKGSLSEPEIHNGSRYGSAMKGLQSLKFIL